MDLALGAHKSINGVLSGPAKHALQAILYQANGKNLRLAPLFVSILGY